MPLNYSPSIAALAHRARTLARSRRAVIGIAGAPGAGKSTLAALLGRELDAPLVAMDAFHLRNADLRALGRHERKGAPDTFDVAGYVDLLRSLRTGADVHAPEFDRALEEPVPDAVLVPAASPIVLTEGNYLLLREGEWGAVAPLLDECWFLRVAEPIRVQRLIDRHIRFGRTPEQARLRTEAGSDAENARLVAATAGRADLLIEG